MSSKNYGPGVTIKNLKDKFVIPGLIDMHTHITVLPLNDSLLANRMDTIASLNSLETFLKFGITTVRNTAGPEEDAVWLRSKVNKDEILGPRIFTAGRAINRIGGGPFIKFDGTTSIKTIIDSQIETGVDYIKIYSTLNPAEAKAAIDYAHEKTVKVIGHLQRTNWTEAAEIGIDFLTHASSWSPDYLSDEFASEYKPTILGRLDWIEHVDLNGKSIIEMIESLKANKVIIDPTLIALHSKFWGDDSTYRNSYYHKFVDASILEIWKQGTYVDNWLPENFQRAKNLWSKVEQYIKLLHDSGIIFTTGTDFPNPWIVPGISLHQEMKLLTECGIDELDVIKIATYNGALALGCNYKIGSIEKNKIADLVILTKNPLENIENISTILSVYKSGKLIRSKYQGTFKY
jgi:imidazolonepropionase-like amidohydrolase